MSVTFSVLLVRDEGRNLVDLPGGPEINVNNGNAVLLLRELGLLDAEADGTGITGYQHGCVGVEEFAERLALAELLDTGAARPALTVGAVHDPGVGPDYLAARLAELSALVRAAHTARDQGEHTEIVWG